MQLVAYGAQDIYLTGNPQITFFKVVYRRHTNFSIEAIEQTFDGNFDFGRKVVCTISRNGDLVHNMYLQVKVPALKQDAAGTGGSNTTVQWANGLGNAMIKTATIEIGGQEIDKHYGEWLDIWGELNVDKEHRDTYNEMVGHSEDHTADNSLHPKTLYVPLRFWFNRNPGLALPLIALQYHEVKVSLELESVKNLVKPNLYPLDSDSAVKNSADSTVEITSGSLYVDYVYLDTDERRRFAQVSHEYLIEQVQHTGSESLEKNNKNSNISLNFNHPVKSLHWVIQDNNYLTGSNKIDLVAANDSNVTSPENNTIDIDKNKGGSQKLVYHVTKATNNKNDTFDTAKLMLNGHDRFSPRDADYFRLVQNYQHMDVCPTKTIYSYSFGLKPCEHQPSGTCNMSRIDNASLNLTFNDNQVEQDRVCKIYAVNYNVLRIMSGMGGLAYSN